MSKKGNKYFVNRNGDISDEFGNQYFFDEEQQLIDSEGQKHTLGEKDYIGFFEKCPKTGAQNTLQSFSLTYEVNISVDLTRGQHHRGHIIPMSKSENKSESAYRDFVEYVESEFEGDLIVLPDGSDCTEDRYKINPSIKIALKNKESNLNDIRPIEGELKLPPLDNETDIKELEKMFARILAHLENELKAELHKTTEQIYHESFFDKQDNDFRNQFISKVLNNTDKGLRKRIPTTKGRVSIKRKNNFEAEKEDFINQCLRGIKFIERENRKLNRTELAGFLYPDSNPQQTLRRKFKTFNLSFEDVLQKYYEQ